MFYSVTGIRELKSNSSKAAVSDIVTPTIAATL